MKKLYSSIIMLAMMAVPMSFTACGDDDDEPETEVPEEKTPEEETPEEETPSDPTPGKDTKIEWGYTITENGKTRGPYGEDTDPLAFGGFYPYWSESNHYFIIGIGIMDTFKFNIMRLTAEDFKPGYNNFTPYVSIEYKGLVSYRVDFEPEHYKSGSATVYANDGKAIYVDFDEYSFAGEFVPLIDPLGSETLKKKYTFTINGRVKYEIQP